MQVELNRLVPADELHWDESSNSYQVLSPEQVDDIIGACMSGGMENPKSILKVVREYERVRCGELLFEQFFAGRVGICGFDESGSPIFDASKAVPENIVRFSCSRESKENSMSELCGWHVVCPEGESNFGLFSEVVDFCSRWGVDLFGGESPEVLGVMNEDPHFQAEFKRRPWRVSLVESSAGQVEVSIRLGRFA